jgi:glutathione S-transferase
MKLFIGNYNYSSWSLRAWLTLKSCDVPFEVELIRLAHETSKKNLSSNNPSGKVPCLEDNGLLIWDTLAICEYLNDQYPQANILPMGIKQRAFVRSCCAEMHSELRALRKECPMEINKPNQKKELSSRTLKEFQRLDQMVQGYQELKIDKSLFDYFITPFAIRSRCFPGNTKLETEKYFEKILQSQAYLEWQKLANQETWVIEY